MKTILLLAAVHLLIVHQSQKKAAKKNTRSQESGYAVKPPMPKPAATILTQDLENRKDKNAKQASFLFNLNMPLLKGK